MKKRGAKLKALREQKGISQDTLCFQVWGPNGMFPKNSEGKPYEDNRRRMYVRWEHGELKYTHSDILDNLAAYYKVSKRAFEI